eukprot:9479478-Pyramimonas_sp.AAC.2
MGRLGPGGIGRLSEALSEVSALRAAKTTDSSRDLDSLKLRLESLSAERHCKLAEYDGQLAETRAQLAEAHAQVTTGLRRRAGNRDARPVSAARREKRRQCD